LSSTEIEKAIQESHLKKLNVKSHNLLPTKQAARLKKDNYLLGTHTHVLPSLLPTQAMRRSWKS